MSEQFNLGDLLNRRPPTGSPPGGTSADERKQVFIMALVAGAAATLTYLADHTADLGLGPLGPLLAASVPVLIEAIRKWATDTRPYVPPPEQPPVPTNPGKPKFGQ